MKLIEKLCDKIEEELCDAEEYMDCALYYQTERPALAATFFKISQEEMVHVNYLHDQVKIIIAEYRKENGEPPAKMQAVYDYIHSKQMTKANTIRVKQMLFKQ